MWILVVPQSSQYNLVAHERWLKPGGRLTIGRHTDNDISLDGAKSVSKQHLEIEVLASAAGASISLEQRSTLVLKDLGSKFKTHLIAPEDGTETQVDGEHRFIGQATDIRLGKAADTIFRVYWLDVVLTLSNIKPKDVQNACDELDIKYSKTYIEQTTHVVTNKYNTPKVLQGLALQKHIVGLEYVRSMRDCAGDLMQNMSAMPDPTDEKLLPSDAFSEEFGHKVFMPKPGREQCFAGLTFVFFTPEQYKSLDAPILAGQGRSSLYSGIAERSAITKYVQQQEHPVIIPPVNDEALTEILDEIVLAIQCATMTQGDFIRVLLSDGKHEVYSAKMLTSTLVVERSAVKENRPPIEARTTDDRMSPAAQVVEDSVDQIVSSSQPDETKKSKRIGSRRVKPLANFEDDLFGSGSSVYSQSKLETQKDGPTQSRRNLPLSRAPADSVDLFDSTFPLTSSQAAPSKSQIIGQPHAVVSPRANRKRRLLDDPLMSQPESFKKTKLHKPSQVQVAEDEEFEVAPAAAAFEKSKSQAQLVQEPLPSETPDVEHDAELASSAPGAKRKRQETVDETEEQIQATLKANMKKAEQQSQANREEDYLVDGEDLRNLGTVEFFHVDLLANDNRSRASQHTATNDESVRWDPRWTGRKNFKKFRRAVKGGCAAGTADASRSAIMIRLVESKPSNRALLDKQWLETATTRDSTISDRNRDVSTSNRGRPTADNLSSQAASAGRSRASQSLFMPAESDSDDDPLKFRM